MRSYVVHPVVSKQLREQFPDVIQGFAAAARPGHEIDDGFVDVGPPSIETGLEEALAVPAVVATARWAESAGYDAVIINCLGDPGLHAAREAVNIPVVGPGEASMHVAAILGKRFSVVTTSRSGVPVFRHIAWQSGLEGSLASVRYIDVAVLDLHESRERMADLLLEEGVKAIEQDCAEVVLLGCTAMEAVLETVEEGLMAYGVPMVNPVACAVKLAETLVDLGVPFSRRSYPSIRPGGLQALQSLLG